MLGNLNKYQALKVISLSSLPTRQSTYSRVPNKRKIKKKNNLTYIFGITFSKHFHLFVYSRLYFHLFLRFLTCPYLLKMSSGETNRWSYECSPILSIFLCVKKHWQFVKLNQYFSFYFIILLFFFLSYFIHQNLSLKLLLIINNYLMNVFTI